MKIFDTFVALTNINITNYRFMEENHNLNRLKVALVERQRTFKWLADQMEKSKTTVSRWASNKSQPSVEQLFEIARHLNMDVKELLNSNLGNK